MAVTTKNLEDALTEAGVEPELAASIAVAMQPFIEDDGVSQAEAVSGERSDSDDVRLARLEQKVDGLRELMMVQFAHVDQRFEEMDKRLDRERRERWGFVTAAAGAITAGLLRVFGAI